MCIVWMNFCIPWFYCLVEKGKIQTTSHSHTTLKNLTNIIKTKVLKSGPDHTIRPEKPQTIQLYGLFRVKNHSMPKKQGPARTTVWPSGFVNHDRFLRFERFLFISAFPVNFGQYTGMKLWSDLEKMKENEEE